MVEVPVKFTKQWQFSTATIVWVTRKFTTGWKNSKDGERMFMIHVRNKDWLWHVLKLSSRSVSVLIK